MANVKITDLHKRFAGGVHAVQGINLTIPDKQFTVMPGISHASFQQKNVVLVYHILLSFLTQPKPAYRG